MPRHYSYSCPLTMPLQPALNLLALLILTLLLLSSASAKADEGIGQILFVHGSAEITDLDGVTNEAKVGQIVSLGDRIVTRAASSLQIQLSDTTYFAIYPNSEIVLKDYQYLNTKKDKVETSLIRGGLRSITGSIGGQNKRAFRLKTPVATIGIRGTDLTAYYIPPDMASAFLGRQGAYLTIHRGGGYLQNASGVQEVKPGQAAYTASAVSPPEPIKQLPPVFKNPTYERPVKGINDQPPEAKPVVVAAKATAPTGSPGINGYLAIGVGRSGHFMHHDALSDPTTEAGRLVQQALQTTPYDADAHLTHITMGANLFRSINAQAAIKAGIGIQANRVKTSFTGSGNDTTANLSGLKLNLGLQLQPTEDLQLQADVAYSDNLGKQEDFYSEVDLYQQSKARDNNAKNAALYPASQPGDKTNRMQLAALWDLSPRVTLFGQLSHSQSRWHNSYANRFWSSLPGWETPIREQIYQPDLYHTEAGMTRKMLQAGVRMHSQVYPVMLQASLISGRVRSDEDLSQDYDASLRGLQSLAHWQATPRFAPYARISLLQLEGHGSHGQYRDPYGSDKRTDFTLDSHIINTTLGAHYQLLHNVQLQGLLQYLTLKTDAASAGYANNQHSLASELQLTLAF